MIFVYENFNIFTENEINFFKNLCDNFILSEEFNDKKNDGTKNYYNRYTLDFEKIEVKTISNKIINKIEEITNQNGLKILGLWINKVDKESNKNDEFHKDISDLTFILYLNENFIGGDFEYMNENKEKIKIKPKTNLSIISNNQLLHRVLPVTEGERFSLVLFFEINRKKEITLI